MAKRQTRAHEPFLTVFAHLMHERYGARLYLFGSHARGTNRPDSDYDIVAVAQAFAEEPPLRRALDRRKLWRAAGGWRIALDLHCYTPEEFRAEVAGAGYLGQAHRKGELIPIAPGKSPRATGLRLAQEHDTHSDAWQADASAG